MQTVRILPICGNSTKANEMAQVVKSLKDNNINYLKSKLTEQQIKAAQEVMKRFI